jgi:phosphoribosylaminoimidazolecarboxamide formyltransferase/IMP cyclohydrolase
MNPHQAPARVYASRGEMPIRVLNGAPGYINLLDALNGWQLVRELRAALDLPAAASFKHVSPAGAAVAVSLPAWLQRAYFVEDMALSPLASAYARARGTDRVSAFGDFAALSDPVDLSTARVLSREVSDGVIAPGYEPDALTVLRRKRGGKYVVLEVDPAYDPPEMERREVFGLTLEQRRNDAPIGAEALADVRTRERQLPQAARRDLLLALITLKYTQSNSVCLVLDGQTVGVGAGQQSRIGCTRLAAGKADLWRLRQHPVALALPFRRGLSRPERDNAVEGFLRGDLAPEEDAVWRAAFEEAPARLSPDEKRAWLEALDGVSLGSDGYIPFRDNVDRARRSGVRYIVQPGGSLRDAEVIAACDESGIAMAFSGLRLFHH